MTAKYIIFPLLLLSGAYIPQMLAQSSMDRFAQLEIKLEEYASEYSNIDKEIDISITGSLQEFALAFSKETKLNLTIAPGIQQTIVTNFSDTRPRDILLHVCRFYNLDLAFSGSIISLIPYDQPEEIQKQKAIDIVYNDYNGKLQLNLQKDTLDQVAKRISELTKKNVITTKATSGLIVSGFIGNTESEEAMEQLARRNDLKLVKDDKGYYVFELNPADEVIENPAKGASSKRRNNSRGRGATRATGAPSPVENLSITKKDSVGQTWLTIDATNVKLADVIKNVSQESGNSFFLFTEPTEQVSIKLKDVNYNEFLEHTLQGSKYAFKEENRVYLIGENTANILKATKVVQLQHRSVKDLTTALPKDLLNGIEVQEFVQLNSFILSGPAAELANVEAFIKEIDKAVPVVMIELLIIDVQNSKETRAGFEMGLAQEPVAAGGKIFSGVDFTFSANAINRLLGSLAGNGIINLGKVSPNFYATLQAVEDNGYVNVRSKPRLSTLNGVEATLSLGETRYYVNERTTLQGNQNPISLQDRRFESVNADFSIRIIPIVAGDEHVTLEIDVNQSDFIGQIQSDAPPAQVNRTFTSNIRILNQEMIVLGGLESKSVEDSGSGVPFLARIPIIKWFFSKRRKAKSKSQLLVFVKPTIIY